MRRVVPDHPLHNQEGRQHQKQVTSEDRWLGENVDQPSGGAHGKTGDSQGQSTGFEHFSAQSPQGSRCLAWALGRLALEQFGCWMCSAVTQRDADLDGYDVGLGALRARPPDRDVLPASAEPAGEARPRRHGG